jgi:hypothetical protein
MRYKTKDTMRIADQFGDAGLGLHRPGYRVEIGGHDGDRALRDGTRATRDEAYAVAEHRLTNAWKKTDWAPENGNDDGDIVAARKQAIRFELQKASADSLDVEDYLNSLDDDDILDGNPDEHRAAFVAGCGGIDSIRDGARAAAVAYEKYTRDMGNAWKNPRPTGARYLDGKSGDYEIDDRCAAICQALLQRGHDRGEIESYLSGLDDDAVLDADVDEPVKAFERQHGGTYERGPRQQGSDVTTLMRDHWQRMAALYAERDRELQEEWRCGK